MKKKEIAKNRYTLWADGNNNVFVWDVEKNGLMKVPHPDYFLYYFVNTENAIAHQGEDVAQTIGMIIKHENRDVVNEKLALKLGISLRTLFSWISGGNAMSKKLGRMADAFGYEIIVRKKMEPKK